MNQIEHTINKWAIKNFGVAVAGSPKMKLLKDELNLIAIPKEDIIHGFLFGDGLIAMSPDILAKDFVPKEELSKLIPYEKHKEVLKNCISKDVLREKIKKWTKDYAVSKGKVTRLLIDYLNEEEQDE